jgi:Cysteine-rich secretory protein family
VPTAGTIAQASQATLCLLDNERAAAGLHPVAETPGLTQPSAAYSARMVAEKFFAHVSPDGGTLVDRLTAARYIAPDGDWTVGENIAWGQGDLATPRNIVVAWMNSPGHRHNILTGEFNEIGLGIALGTPGDPSWGATYTTDFGAVAGHEPVATAASARTAAATAAPAARTATKTAKTAKRCGAAARARAAKAGKSVKAKTAKKGARAKRVAPCGTPAKGRAAKTTKR